MDSVTHSVWNFKTRKGQDSLKCLIYFNGWGEWRGGGGGLMLALILVTHLVDGNKQKTDQEIVTTDFNSPGPLLLSILILGKFIGLTYLRTIMKMTTI